MIKKIFKIGVPLFLLSLIVLIGYKNYKEITKNTATPLDVIPMNAALIIQINKPTSLNNYLNDKYISRKIKNIILPKLDIGERSKQISELYKKHNDILEENLLLISVHKYGAEDIGVLFSTIINKQKKTNESIIKLIGESIETQETYDNHQIIKIKNQEYQLYLSIIEDFLFASTEKILVQDAIRQFKSDMTLTNSSEFNHVYSTIDNHIPLNLIYNLNNVLEITLKQKRNKKIKHHLGSWAATDIKIKEETISINGFSMINSKLENFSDILLGQKNKELKIDKYLPSNTSYLLSLGFGNANRLYENKNHFLQNHNKLWQTTKLQNKIFKEYQFDDNEFINNIADEVGIFACPSLESTEEQINYIKTKNAILTIGLLQNLIIESKEIKYRKYVIGEITNSGFLPNLFTNIINKKNTPYFTSIDNYIFFASSVEALKYIIDKYNTQQTLRNNPSFKRYKNIISENFNLFLYVNIRGNTFRYFKQELKDKLGIHTDSLDKFTGASFQLSNNRNMLINNISLLYDKEYKNRITERWALQLDSTIHMPPNIVYNHFTKENEILVQDRTKKIYFISKDGVIRWERKINEYILGGISQIDFYNNQKNQFLFNTKDKLYLIDRNGKDVENYPIKLPQTTNLGHSLFDYEKTKEYRILIVGQNNIIYNVNKKGKKVFGWKFEKITDKIISNPQHFVENKKDYIICPTQENQLYLLARNGSRRITLKLKNKLTSKKIKTDKKGQLYSSDIEGELWIGNINGMSSNIEIPDFNYNSQLCIRYIDTSKTQKEAYKQDIVFSNKNLLYIIDQKFNLTYKESFDSPIRKISTFNKNKTCYLLVETEEKLYLLEDDNIIDDSIIDIKGENTVNIFNNKINIINSKNNVLFSYELDI